MTSSLILRTVVHKYAPVPEKAIVKYTKPKVTLVETFLFDESRRICSRKGDGISLSEDAFGNYVCHNMLFPHSILGYDTTSRL